MAVVNSLAELSPTYAVCGCDLRARARVSLCAKRSTPSSGIAKRDKLMMFYHNHYCSEIHIW